MNAFRKIRADDMADDKEFILLQRRLEQHLDDYREHVEDDKHRWSHLMELQERNSTLQEKNMQAIGALTTATQGMVEAWQAADGAIKVGSALGRLVKWASGIAVVGVAVTWAIEKFS